MNVESLSRLKTLIMTKIEDCILVIVTIFLCPFVKIENGQRKIIKYDKYKYGRLSDVVYVVHLFLYQ